MKYGLTDQEIDLIKGVFEKTPEVESVFIYGSRAKNTFKKTSDIDLAIIFQNGTKNILGKLKAEMEDLQIIYEIDLTDEADMLAGNFKDEYERTKQVFYLKGWKMTTLGEVAEKMFSGGTPSTKQEDFYGGTVPWLRTQEVNFNYIYDTDIKITETGLQNSSAKWTPENTVIIAMYGNSAGRTAFSKIRTTTNQACCNFVANSEKADPLFIYFNLKSRYSEIEGMANGAAQQNLSVGGLKELKVFLPPLLEQRAISAVLSSLDDKIELLREQNKTLETAALAIFKEWFVNFNFPGSTGKMIASELGQIPEGWRVGKLNDLVIHNKDSILPLKSPLKYFNCYSIPAFDSGKEPETQWQVPRT